MGQPLAVELREYSSSTALIKAVWLPSTAVRKAVVLFWPYSDWRENSEMLA